MRSLALSVCLFLAAFSAFAQETRYRLERVVVEGSGIDEDVIRAETRLEEEKTYTEEDFRQGVYRVRRLPFVTDAAYRIEPGVTGGGTTLVIRILQESPVFYNLNVATTQSQADDADSETVGDLLLGGRYLLGNLGVIEGGVQKSSEDDSGILAGLIYRAYDIYGTGGYARLAVAQRFQTSPVKHDPDAALTLGWPLTQKQTLTFSASRTKTREPRDFDVNGDDNDDDDDDEEDDNRTLTSRDRFEYAELRWWYETIDDPIFTSRGVQISGGPHWALGEAVREAYDPVAKVVVATEASLTTLGVGLNAAGYHPLTRRNSVFVKLDGDVARTREDDAQEISSGSARLGFTHDFHSYAENTLRPVRMRLEVGAGYGGSVLKPPVGDEVRNTGAFGEAAFVLRHRWGTLRLSAFYDAED